MSTFFSIKASSEEVADEIKNILNNYYIEDVSKNTLNRDSVQEIINDLEDPYTQVMSQEYFNKVVNSSFVGIGISIKSKESGVEVTSVMVNSPAMKAGIMIGDVISSIDGESINVLSEENALKKINGEFGVNSILEIERENKTLLINVVPNIVYYPTVFVKIIDENIGYIQIVSFGNNTLGEFEYMIKANNMKEVNSYIIDLRYNFGGYIYSAAEIGGYFSKNNVVAGFQSKNSEKFSYRASKKNLTIDKPTIFLVNEFTASASELLVACAQDYGTAVIVGEKTYGKGVAQSTFMLSDGRMLKTTTLKLYSPKGRDISTGITPDIYIKDIDTLMAGELLSQNKSSFTSPSRIVKATIKGKDYYINLDKITNNIYLDAYKQIIGQASYVDASNLLQLNQNGKVNYPVIKYAGVPKTDYKINDRIVFKFHAPNYNGTVQYRAMLWDDTIKKYADLWNTNDRYYGNWKPMSKSIFTISYPAVKAGNYKIKVFVKRSGLQNSKTALKGMNCDSYVYEIPYTISSKN